MLLRPRFSHHAPFLAQYVNLEEDNDKSDSALHKVAAVAWTFTTMRSAGIPKKCLPRRVRKAMLFYMGKVAKSDRAEFLNLKVEDLAGTRILDETEEGGKTLEIDTAAWRSAVAENKKELGWRQHHEFAVRSAKGTRMTC